MEPKVAPERSVNLEALRQVLAERYRPRDHREAQELIVGACQEAQRLYGWVPPEAAELIANHLGVTINRVYGLLTFYADFRTQRPGRHYLWLCYGAACYVAGARRVIEMLRDEYGMDEKGDTADGTLSVNVFNGCLGVCDLAPAAQLDHHEYLGNLNVESLRDLIERLRREDEAEGKHGGSH
jgi:NADH-quinone oxidoreductase subunit E